MSLTVGLFISTGPLGFCVTGAIGACAGGSWMGCGLYWSLWALPPWGVIAVAAPGSWGTQPPFATWALTSNCGAHLVESYCKESNTSDTNWLRYASSSYMYLIKIWLCMTSSLGWFEYLWNKNRSLKIVNSIFLLMQATCLCFKMASQPSKLRPF